MWVFLNDAFMSIVEDASDRRRLLVRARCEGDIERVFRDCAVHCTPDADYRYRASLPRETVAEVLADEVRRVNYPNFKDSVKGHRRHRAYSKVWETMLPFGRT